MVPMCIRDNFTEGRPNPNVKGESYSDCDRRNGSGTSRPRFFVPKGKRGRDVSDPSLARVLNESSRAWAVLWVGVAMLIGTDLFAAVDESRLPPALSRQIDFDREVQPLFERSCIKCHGPTKPKSKFRLDNRDSALKGGEDGVDIVPGHGAKSPLVHYVAGLVKDMEMPPKGEGQPLTAEEIAILRTWIDQGASWGSVAPEPKTTLVTSAGLGWSTVSGSESTFREHYWRHDGWNAGFDRFELSDRVDDRTKLTASGHTLRDDYKVALELSREEVGFTRLGFQQYRKYYSDLGGYYPEFSPPVYSLDHDLHLDLTKVWFDVGLTLPRWPMMVVGYEYQSQRGEKSMLEWGSVAQGLELNGDARARNNYPAFKRLEEKVNILKFDLNHDIAGYHLENNFRAEFYDLGTSRTNVIFDPGVSNFNARRIDEGYRHFQGANTFRVEKSFKDWLYASGGYLYSRLNADTEFSLDPLFLTGVALPLAVEQWRTSPIVLERESHVANLNTLVGPWAGLSFSAGVQAEWSRQKGMGEAEQQILFTSGGLDPITNRFTLSSDLDKSAVEENLALRFAKIPYTLLFAEARFRQESIGQFESQGPGSAQQFLRQTDADDELRDYRVGFTTSPWQRVTFSGHYRRYESINHYNHGLDALDDLGTPNEGYSAFIRSRDSYTDEIEAKLIWRMTSWLKTTFKYQLVSTETFTGTDPVSGDISPGGRIFAGNYDAHVFSLGATLTPWRRWYVSSTFTFQDARTVTFANDSPSIAPYQGQIYSVLNNVTFALNPKTDLFAAYNFSLADFNQHNLAEGLPLGVNYQQHAVEAGVSRRFLQNFMTRLQYGFFRYADPGSGHAADYSAHALFATLTVRWP